MPVEAAEIEEQTKKSPEKESKDEPTKLEFQTEEDSSPRGVLEIPISITGSDFSGSTGSAGSPKSTAQRGVLRESQGIQWKTMIDALKKKSARRFSTIPLLAASYDISRRRLARIRSAEDGIDCNGIPFRKPTWRNFDYAELAAATCDFSPENLLGKGGQAEVYKGCLSNGQFVAVKRLMKKDKENQEDRIGDFLSELGIIAHIDHPNAARLLGFGIDSGLYLVLDFSPNGSLSSHLFGSSGCLEWNIRYKVALGVAEGLRYLHHECQRRIIHRDIKASNVLLAHDYQAQISDFGLAKWLPEKWAHHVVFPIEGTFGYLAPEYFMHGIVDEKTDVFAFGVLLLELVTGRHAVDSSRQSLVIWAKPLLDNNNIKELADPKLENTLNSAEMKRVMLTASMCIHHSSSLRPDMKRVVQLLKGESGAFELRQISMGGKSLLVEACDLEDYTCSNYLNDLNRHRQLVLE